jgi:tetratricopeptide (TPR) repeat protein
MSRTSRPRARSNGYHVVTGYLRPAIKHGAVDLWLDRLMPLGANWEPEIEKKFRACDIFILLVSRHSLSSNYVVDKEIPIIRARQANGEAVHFYPLVLTPTPKAGLRLVSDKNLRPRDGKPLSDYPLHERYRHMAEAADEIAEIAAEIQSRKTLAPAQPSLDTASILGARQDGSLDQSKAKPRNLPFASLGGLFAGRDEDLADLHTALLGAKGAPVALHGLGGIGKTRLAIEYGWSREAVYSALLFVSASDGAALNAGLAGLTAFENLDLPEKEARDDATKITAVLRWLEANPTWLMILDNVDDRLAVGEVAKLMPRLKGGHVVVTARASNFPAGFRKLEVSMLDEDAAAQFLLDRTNADRSKSKDDMALARTLAQELGGLALGLEQAGAHIATDRIGFARYLKLWSESREKALAWADATVTGSDRTLATTWATSVARLSPGGLRLLERLAFLAPDSIPDSLLDVAVPGEANTDAYEARRGLYAYSLISGVTAEDGGAPGFVVHRLVQDFARGAMSDQRRHKALREALVWVNAAFVGTPSDVRSWPVLDPLAPHALAVAQQGDGAEIAEPVDRLMSALGTLSQAKGRYAEAELLKRRAVAIGETSLVPSDPKLATLLNNLAQLLQLTNRFAEAESLMRRALAIWEAGLGADHPQVATGLNNLALLLKDTNRLAEAEPLMRRALAIDETSYGPDHPDVAIDLNNLAALLHATNRLAEAEPLMRRALAIDETSYGPDHPEVAIDLNNLAQLLKDANRLAEAEPLTRRALAIDEASYGPDHPNVATRLNNLAGLLKDTNRLADAEPLFRRALAIDKKSYGPNHPKVAIDLSSLAGLLQATNRLAEAEPLMRRALAILKTSLGPDHQGGDQTQQSRASASGHDPPRRGRAAPSPRAGNRRDKLRPGSSRCRDRPQQSRRAVSGHEPSRRSRAAPAPCARNFPGEPRAGPSLDGRRAQQPRRSGGRS